MYSNNRNVITTNDYQLSFFKAKMPNIFLFQLSKCEALLIDLSISYNCSQYADGCLLLLNLWEALILK